MPVKSGNNFCAYLLIRSDHFPQVLRIELSRQGRGIHQITKHHGKLTAFSIRCVRCRWWWFDLRRLIVLEMRLLCRLVRLRGLFLKIDTSWV